MSVFPVMFLVGNMAAAQEVVEEIVEVERDCQLPLAPAPDAEGGWGLLWQETLGVRESAVVVHPYGAGTEIELRVLVFRDGMEPVEQAAGSALADATGGAETVAVDLGRLMDSKLASVSVFATAYSRTGQRLGTHGVHGYAYADDEGQVVILTEAEASAQVTAVADGPDDGAETPDLVGQEVI